MFEGRRHSLAEGPESGRQEEVIRWFDETYEKLGCRYLRPPQAYRVFPALLAAHGQTHHEHRHPDTLAVETLEGKRLLDVACGPGLLLGQALTQGLEVAGIDISPVAIEAARSALGGVPLEVGSAENLPFTDQAFDYVTCVGSLERFLDADRALQEMRRVLKPDGLLLIMVRNSRTLHWQVLDKLGLKNAAGHQGADHDLAWRKRLRTAGFTIFAVYPDQWPLMWRQRLQRRLCGRGDFTTPRRGILPLTLANELIYLCRRSDC